MLITPLLLADEPLILNEQIPEGAIDYTADVRQAGSLTVNGQADLIVEHRGHREQVADIRLRAKVKGHFEVPCARCLEPVAQTVATKFDLIFRPAGADAAPGEHAISEDETEIGYYERSGLPLEDAVREQVLLALPGRVLCREDCKGLCPHCGADRNQTPCHCDDRPTDPRWNALAGLAAPRS